MSTGDPWGSPPEFDEEVESGRDDGDDACSVDSCAPEMVDVAGGTFFMGCNPAVDSACRADEQTQHKVTVASFEIGLSEVTNAQYSVFLTKLASTTVANDCAYEGESQACLGCDVPYRQIGCTTWQPLDGCGTRSGGTESCATHPVVGVTWYGARAYCAWLGPGYRLPSEAEWELAARGSCGRHGCATGDDACCKAAMPTYPWGNAAASCEYAVMHDDGGGGCGTYGLGVTGTFSVGSTSPKGDSPYNAQDMAGNVWEWVEDAYHDTYDGAPVDGGAWVGSGGSGRVFRGGGFDDSGDVVRASARGHADFPSSTDSNVGFRCAKSVP